VQTAKRMGINSALAANPSIALGTSEVNLLELTGAYAPFSNGGFAVMPYVVQRIRTPNGKVLFSRTGSGLGHVASLQSVAMMNDMLQATVEMGTGTKASIAGWPAGGKTGTSQDFRDAWFIGYTANLTAGVWVGNDSNAPTKHASGANVPAMIWSNFMTGAHAGVPVAELPGGDLTAFLLAQPATGSQDWTAAQATANDRVANEATMREWILSGGEPVPQPAAAVPTERRGFFRRLFGRN
jgi:penicillin-binding protein 1A